MNNLLQPAELQINYWLWKDGLFDDADTTHQGGLSILQWRPPPQDVSSFTVCGGKLGEEILKLHEIDVEGTNEREKMAFPLQVVSQLGSISPDLRN
jgi:hypothetical protein